MPPFIKFTERIAGVGATTVYFRYVNASHIAQAKYDQANKKLWLTIDGKDVELTGDEAEAALAILQKL